MAYVNLDPDFPNHPKCVRLQARCGANSHLLLIPLFCFAAKYHPADGNLSKYTPQEIESFAGWIGESGFWHKTCKEIGWIDKNNCLHDWKNHQGHIVAYKERSTLAAKTRWGKILHKSKQDIEINSIATSTAQAVINNSQAQVLNQALPTLPTLPDRKDKTLKPAVENPTANVNNSKTIVENFLGASGDVSQIGKKSEQDLAKDIQEVWVSKFPDLPLNYGVIKNMLRGVKGFQTVGSLDKQAEFILEQIRAMPDDLEDPVARLVDVLKSPGKYIKK